jgi:haloalkane dehalogenase
VSATIRRGYVPAGRVQIHYRRAGDAKSPLLVLLHQTPSTSAMYEPLMARLAGRFDVLAPDTPGFGNSDALDGPFTIANAASALAAAVRWIRKEPAFWFGHHTGAALALQVAATHPEQVSRLALSGPCLLDAALRERLPKVAAPVPVAADGSHLKVLWDRMAAKDPEAPPHILQREALAGAAAGDCYPQAYRAVTEVDTAAQLRSLACPTLVFAGTQDPLYAAVDDSMKLLKHGRRAEIAGARTFVCERQADEVAALLGEFFGETGG